MPSKNDGNRSENNLESEARQKMELEVQIKDKERQEEEVMEELEKFMTQEMAEDFLYLRRHC